MSKPLDTYIARCDFEQVVSNGEMWASMKKQRLNDMFNTALEEIQRLRTLLSEDTDYAARLLNYKKSIEAGMTAEDHERWEPIFQQARQRCQQYAGEKVEEASGP